VGELRAAPDANPLSAQKEKQASSARHKYARLVAELEAKQKQGPLPVTDAITLSACYIRLGRTEKARVLLDATERTVPEDDPHRFLVYLNRAAAYQETPDLLRRAIEDQSEALRSELWPKELKGWSADDLAWYRVAEGYYLRYLQARWAETQRPSGNPAHLTIAPIFPKARFDEPGWRYTAGLLPADTADALPMDALQVAQQMLLWLPNDPRLIWLYAECLNGRGDVATAHRVLDDLVANRNVRTPAVMEHRRILGDGLLKDAPAQPSAPAAPVSGPDWRQLGGSLLAGALVGVVLTVVTFLQWRQWTRKRATR
jgi:hypothetical protein